MTYKPTHKSSPPHGFSLVELLIVISIIVILAVISAAVYSNIQKTARETKRKSDIQALAKAVTLYSFTNGSFPNTGTYLCSNNVTDWNALKTLLDPYIQNFPKDPLNGSANGCVGGPCIYCYTANMWCQVGFSGPSCSAGIANFWAYQETNPASDTGDAPRFGYAQNHYMKSINPF